MIKVMFDEKSCRSVALDDDIEIGKCEFKEVNGVWNIIHTEVNSLYQGQGIARKLVDSVIENARLSDKRLIAECSYAKKVLEKTAN